MLSPKSNVVRDANYLVTVRTLPCVLTGTFWTPEGSWSIDAAHIRHGLGGGTGMKPGDDLVVPLRHDLHLEQGGMSEAEFWVNHFYDRDVFARAAMRAYGNELSETMGTFGCCVAPGDLEEITMARVKAYARELYRRYKNNSLDLPF